MVEENDEVKEETDEESMPVTTKAPDAPLTPGVKNRKRSRGVFEQLRVVLKS